MSSTVRVLPASRRQQLQYKEQRRKKVEEYLLKKMALTEPRQSLQSRSPLTEKNNLVNLPNQTEANKLKQTNLVNKENIVSARSKSAPVHRQSSLQRSALHIDLAVKKNPISVNTVVTKGERKETRGVSVSQSFLKSKFFKEKQLIDEKINAKANKLPEKPAKPVLGTYRGKVVQSKINSFRKPSDGNETNSSTQDKKQQVNSSKTAPSRPTSNVAVKQVPKSAAVGSTRQSVPAPSNTRSQLRTSNVVKNRPELGTTKVYTTSQSQIKSVGVNVLQKPGPTRNPKPTGHVMPQTDLNRRRTVAGPQSARPAPQHRKTTSQPVAPVNKFPKAKETAEERKARLAEWKAAKVTKRPPTKVMTSNTCEVSQEEPESKQPVQQKEPTPKLFWATMAEEDEQELFTIKVHKMFAECQKLIDENLPKEEILGILETQIQSVPEAKKISKYWECLAHLEKREGQLDKVISICEEAVTAGAQPLDELRNILADALESLKLTSDAVEHSQEIVPKEEIKKEESELQIEPLKPSLVEATKGRKSKRRNGIKNESKEKKLTWDIDEKPPVTPENNGPTSVIKFNVRSTPYLQSVKKKIHSDGEPLIKDLKFLTPVRRSTRIERNSQQLPDMLKDHDPCVSTLSQLGELGSDTQAYIYRQNDAIQEVTVKNLPK
ncbi:cytoskeleton-associated protein 2 [Bombina bombina]|uniref:cytoskeleton-associated protein 2 n=1 Tax=Bombina bombina TaxID=8345 RepID=UPI00235ABAB1|nr:cytoskeleton-associated protein 2 [Bombina bombina]